MTYVQRNDSIGVKDRRLIDARGFRRILSRQFSCELVAVKLVHVFLTVSYFRKYLYFHFVVF